MRARRLLILLMMLLLLPQAQAERLTLYTRPGQVDEATPFQLRPTELSICSVTRAMGGVVVLAMIIIMTACRCTSGRTA